MYNTYLSKTAIIKAISPIIAVIGVITIFTGFISIPAGNVAVIYDRGKGVLENEIPEGLHFKIPLWQTATIMNTRLQTYTMSIATGEGVKYGSDAIEALTKDGQIVNIDVSVQFRISSEDASDLYQKIGLDYREKVIRPQVRSIVREVITGYESKSLFKIESRKKAEEQIETQLKNRLANKYITLDSILLRNVRFSDEYIKAIEDKQIAEQRIQKAEYEKLEAEKVKERKIIEAEGEAEAIKLKGEKLKANPQVIQFEFVQKMAPGIKWGILPDSSLPMINLQDFTN